MEPDGHEIVGAIICVLEDSVYFPQSVLGRITAYRDYGTWRYSVELINGQYLKHVSLDELEILEDDDPRMLEYMLWVMKH